MSAAALREELEKLKAQNASLRMASEVEPQPKATATPEVEPQLTATAISAPNPDPDKACENYKVDMAAANFGDCKCGYAKKDHAPAAFASRGGGAKRPAGLQLGSGAAPAGQTVAPLANAAAATRPQTAPPGASAQTAAVEKEAAEKAAAEEAATEKAAEEREAALKAAALKAEALKAAALKAAADKAAVEKEAAEEAATEKAAKERETALKAAAEEAAAQKASRGSVFSEGKSATASAPSTTLPAGSAESDEPSDASEPPAPPPVIAPLRLTPVPPEKGGAAENKGTPRGKASPREKGTPRGLDRAKMANEIAAEMRCPLTGRHAAPKDEP